MKTLLLNVVTAVLLCLISNISTAAIQPPPPVLGPAASFAVFTSVGAVTNDGATIVTGDVGSHVGGVTGFPPGVVIGSIHDADGAATAAWPAVCAAYMYLDGILGGTTIGITLGSGQTLLPDVYILTAASTLDGALILDGGGNSNAIFIFQIDGAFSTTSGSTVTLINGASFCNVYWQVNGAVTLGPGSIFQGTIIANGAIHALEAASLSGRALSCPGAIDLHNNIITNGIPIASIITASGPTTFCAGDSVTLSGNVGGTWSTGATSASIIVTTSGGYFVTNTDACGTAISDTIVVTVNPLPECDITGDLSFCEGESSELCAGPLVTGNTYAWNTNEFTRCITVAQEGIYTVTVTDANGCSSTCSAAVAVNLPPSCTITGGDIDCDEVSSELCVPHVSGNTYEWSTGATTNCITVAQEGIYTVTVTDANGCSSTCSASVAVNLPPSCTITGGDIDCDEVSSELCVPHVSGNTYEWSTGATTNCITVAQEGIYTVTVTDANGCSSTCSAAVAVNLPPSCTIDGGDIDCDEVSSELCVPHVSGNTYEWSTGATTNCITVAQEGIYTVTVTDANGCSSTCSAAVAVNLPPSCTIDGGDIDCDEVSSELCVPHVSGNTYEWSTGATTNCITVAQEGIYTVTVTDANGCSSTCSAAVAVNLPPSCTIDGGDIDCDEVSSELCVPHVSGNTYEWSTGATTNCITVAQEGIYTVTVTDANGCSSTCSAAVAVNLPPSCTIDGGDIDCDEVSSELCVPHVSGNTYEWSTGATTNCITVAQEGIYTVTVTDANGCSSTCSAAVAVNLPPSCTITGGDIDCDEVSSELCVPHVSGNTYEWSTGATTNCITVAQEGIYTVTVTDANGCSSTCSAAVAVNLPPSCTIDGGDIDCDEVSSELCVPHVSGNTYEWSTGATTNCITVAQEGIYTVTVTDANGCSSTCSAAVAVNLPPSCTIDGGDIDCDEVSSELCVPHVSGNTYEWSTGATTNCITVAQEGIYTVTVTDANGCSSTCSAAVAVNLPPSCTIDGGDIDCDEVSSELCVPHVSGNTYEWSTGATTNCITVALEGIYTVTVTDANGCSSTCSAAVAVNLPPSCTIDGGDIDCDEVSSELCVPHVSGNTYEWSTGATTNCITVAQEGIYTVTVTDANGCSSTCSAAVAVNLPPSCTITGGDIDCDEVSSELCVPHVSGNTYEWSTGATTNCITVAQEGIYTVTVTDANGCSSTCSAAVAVNLPPSCTIDGGDIDCDEVSSELCVPHVSGNTYEWSTGATTNCITVAQEGIYTVTVTDANGCSSTCSAAVAVNLPPSCTITGGDIDCDEESTELCVLPGASSYMWNTGATTNCITVFLAGTYSVTVTDVNGCSSTCSHVVMVTPTTPPVITCPVDVTIECDDSSLPLNTGSATATDSCNITPTISYVDVVALGLCPQESTITRTWTVAYGIGNNIICAQVISVVDTTSPVIVCPPDMTIECNESTQPANTGTATATDICSLSPSVDFSDVISTADCPLGTTITRTWVATDACGNTNTCVQVITILDNAPPTIEIVNPLLAANGDTTFIQCYGQDPLWDLPLFDESSVEATDICAGEVTVAYSQVLVNEGDCEEDGYIVVLRLTWTATDLCGNSSTAFVYLALVDTIAPLIFGVPGDTTVNCSDIPVLPVLVYATDECLCVCLVLVQESILPTGCLNGGVLLRTWTASDRCGNETVVTQRITLVDEQGPALVIVQPEILGVRDGSILEYACSDGGMPDFLDLLDAESVSGAGSCGGGSISMTFRVISEAALNCGLYGYIEQQTFIWTAIDECGNSSSMTIIARLIDDEPPVLVGVPELMTCIGDPALREIYATDNCEDVYSQFWDVDIPNPCGIGIAVQRTYEAYDDCGNATRASVILLPDDLTAPAMAFVDTAMNDLELGEIMVVNCVASDGKHTAFSANDVYITDPCAAGVTVTFAERLISTEDCTTGEVMAVIELKWIATDVCGNVSEHVILAHVVDDSHPVFVNFEPAVTIGCNDAMPVISASDNCGDVVITFVDTILLSDCEYEYVIQREITATDPCGNRTTRRQLVHVGDGSGPAISGVVDELCDDLTIPPVTAFDACAGEFVEVTMTQDTLDVPCRDGLVIQRSWSAVDACGNVNLIHQTIVMHDTTPPVLIPAASILSKLLDFDHPVMYLSEEELMDLLNALDDHSVLATDECDEDIVPVLTVDILLGDCKDDGYTERRVYTWLATDVCGNTASMSASVDIIDNVPPQMQEIPPDTVIVCVELPLAQAMLVDSLDQATIVYSEVMVPGDSPNEFLVTRSWVSTDSCGNASVVFQRIIWIPDTYLVCEVLVPPSIECNSHGVIIGSIVTGGFGSYTYEWEVVGEKCFIQGGQGTPELSIYIGWGDVKITLTVTDTFGCVSMCMIVLNCDISQVSTLGLQPPINSLSISEQLAQNNDQGLNLESGENLSQLNVWPNPTTGSVALSFESAVDEEIQFTYTNLLGQEVLNEQFTALRGLNIHKTNLGNLPPGSYLMQMKTKTETHSKVIVVIPIR